MVDNGTMVVIDGGFIAVKSDPSSLMGELRQLGYLSSSSPMYTNRDGHVRQE